MKRNLFWVFFLSVTLIAAICGAQGDLDPPDNLVLTADMDSITATWDREFDADDYVVYWGTESGNPSDQKTVPDSGNDDEISTTITGLQPETTYYVEVASRDDFGGESDDRATRSIRTLGDTEAPGTPSGLWVKSLNDITTTSIILKWNENTDDFDHYVLTIRSGTTSTTVNVTGETYTANGLTPKTRYYFSISAVDQKGNESSKSDEIAVDTLVDELGPFTPGVTASLSGNQEVTVKLQNENENMVDYVGNFIYYGQNPESLDQKVDLGTSLSYVFKDLPVDTTWYFSATAYDHSGNESTRSSVTSMLIERTVSYLEQGGKVDGGCFISNLFDPPSYDVTENRNKVGVSAGYYLPAESDFEDFYGSDTYPAFLFYERSFTPYLSADLKAGYLAVSGELRTVSGEKTDIDSDFTLAPVSASLNLNFPLIPHIWGFVGAGPDYWYYDEESDLSSAGNNDWVGGYHFKTGLWLYNRDPEFKNWGALFEVDYARIDKFGSNDVDLGGWLFLIGAFYSF